MYDDINEVRLIGNITNDLELKSTPSGTSVLSFTMATNRRFKQGEEWKDEVNYHNLVVWGKDAERLAEVGQKGTRLYAGGRLQTRKWEGKDGKLQYKTEIVADTISLISRFKAKEVGQQTLNIPETTIDPDDLPF